MSHPTGKLEWLIGKEARSPAALQAWQQLFDADTEATIASAPAWWQFVDEVFAPSHQHRLLLLRRGSRLVGAWPLAVRTDQGRFLDQRVLTSANGYHAYYGDPLIDDRGDTGVNTTEELLAAAQRAPRVDRIDLNRVHLGRHEWLSERITSNDPIIACGTDAPLISGQLKREINRSERRLREVGDLTIDRVVGNDLGKIGAEFARLHTALKTMQRQWRLFDEYPGSAARLGPALANGAIAPHAGAVRISLNGTAVGFAIILTHGGESVHWRTAWDPDFARFGIGALLLREAVSWSRDRGEIVFRLGPGNEPHKLRWATDVSQVSRLIAHRPTVASCAWRLGRWRR